MLRDLPSFEGHEADEVFMNGAPGVDQAHETHADQLDDVFGSAPASPTLGGEDGLDSGGALSRPSAPERSDIPRLRSVHVTNGYREGIAVSKEKYMQDGFDEGYSLGAELGLKAGWCLGALEGIWRALPAETAGTIETGHASSAEAVTKGNVAALLNTAKVELDISKLCGKEHFGEDGIWLYDVTSHEAERQEPTFEEVAAAHPTLHKWTSKVFELAAEVGLELRARQHFIDVDMQHILHRPAFRQPYSNPAASA